MIETMRDSIMDRYAELSLLNEIPDMGIYSAEWLLLAFDCDKESRNATAETCRKRAEYYCRMAGGQYIRLIEGCFAELISVPFASLGESPTAADDIARREGMLDGTGF
jgi:hypothetical protein